MRKTRRIAFQNPVIARERLASCIGNKTKEGNLRSVLEGLKKEQQLINEEPIHKEMPSNERAKYLRILDKAIVTLMLAILMVLSLPVLNFYHAPKVARRVPQMRSAPSKHQVPAADRLIIA